MSTAFEQGSLKIVIDQQEAEIMALRELNPDKPEKYEISRTEEKPYGWVLYIKRADGEPPSPGGCHCVVVEKDSGKISKLSGSFISVVLSRFEEGLDWQARPDQSGFSSSRFTFLHG